MKQYKGEIDYLTTHGISKETAIEYKIGLDDSDNDEELTRLVIPYHYAGDPEKAERRHTHKAILLKSGVELGGETPDTLGYLFNVQALKRANNNHVYVCMDELDALSIGEAGGEAVAMLNIYGFEEIARAAEGTSARLVIAMNKTDGGKQAAAYLAGYLQNAGKDAPKVDMCKDHQTVNEYLAQEREAFIESLREAIPPAELYKSKDAAHMIDELQAYIKASAQEPAISTGLLSLDALLDDGIKTGLYIVGAISSLGKTTFIIQIADYIAKQGHDVLFFSLEQSAREIIAKSISRETYDAALKLTQDTRHAKSTTGILNGRYYAKYTEQEKQIIQDATASYRAYADKLHIIEGMGNVGVKRIEEGIKEHETLTGHKPIVFIDYLQLLTEWQDAENPRRQYTDKQIIDRNILELKRLSRKYTIIAISSFNRDSYTDIVSMAAFKESGAIEYTSDVLIGLQYDGLEDKNAKERAEAIEEQKRKGRTGEGQDIQLKVLKNRLYKTGNMRLKFYPACNLYLEEKHGKGETTRDGDGFTMDMTGTNNPFDSAPYRY